MNTYAPPQFFNLDLNYVKTRGYNLLVPVALREWKKLNYWHNCFEAKETGFNSLSYETRKISRVY